MLITELQKRAQTELLKRITHTDYLSDVLAYVVKAGGKRFRPQLTYATAHLFTIAPDKVDDVACAIEFIHMYSLIHDDLPSMDNDDIRHGIASCHKKFGEANAILAGDLLQPLAFTCIAESQQLTDAQKVNMTQTLAHSSGQMVEGQALDLQSASKRIDLTTLGTMHRLKTGALINCAVRLGALCYPDIQPDDLVRLEKMAQHIGLAYQIQDDVLEKTTNSSDLGKSATSDADNNKTTYVDCLGVDAASKQYQQLYQQADTALAAVNGNREWLQTIISAMQNRRF